MTSWLDLMRSTYKKGGRGPREYDCWGLTRTGLHVLFGRPLLPSCADAVPGKVAAITRTVHHVAQEFGMVERRRPAPGMVATGWHGNLCVHVGLVIESDGLLYVFETDEPTGPTCTRLRAFEGRYSKVIYYEN